MGDLMLLGVLRMPFDDRGDMHLAQLHSRCRQAADELEKRGAEIDRLRAALKQALRQWEMYAETVEARDEFDFKTEQSPEADMYRAALALVNP
jgi:hypothetical protein